MGNFALETPSGINTPHRTHRIFRYLLTCTSPRKREITFQAPWGFQPLPCYIPFIKKMWYREIVKWPVKQRRAEYPFGFVSIRTPHSRESRNYLWKRGSLGILPSPFPYYGYNIRREIADASERRLLLETLITLDARSDDSIRRCFTSIPYATTS